MLHPVALHVVTQQRTKACLSRKHDTLELHCLDDTTLEVALLAMSHTSFLQAR